MADFNTETIFQPLIPAKLVTEEDRAVFDAFNITVQPQGESVYLYSEEWSCSARVDGVELEEDDLFARFQEIIRRSNGELLWVSTEAAHTCSKMRPDGFGGSAAFITADDVQYTCTSSWLTQRISESETGDAGPHTDDEEYPKLFSVDLIYQGKGNGYTAVAEKSGEPGVYDEIRVGIFKGEECVGDVLFTLTENGEPAALLTTDGDGEGDHSLIWFPLRDSDSAINDYK